MLLEEYIEEGQTVNQEPYSNMWLSREKSTLCLKTSFQEMSF